MVLISLGLPLLVSQTAAARSIPVDACRQIHEEGRSAVFPAADLPIPTNTQFVVYSSDSAAPGFTSKTPPCESQWEGTISGPDPWTDIVMTETNFAVFRPDEPLTGSSTHELHLRRPWSADLPMSHNITYETAAGPDTAEAPLPPSVGAVKVDIVGIKDGWYAQVTLTDLQSGGPALLPMLVHESEHWNAFPPGLSPSTVSVSKEVERPTDEPFCIALVNRSASGVESEAVERCVLPNVRNLRGCSTLGHSVSLRTDWTPTLLLVPLAFALLFRRRRT